MEEVETFLVVGIDAVVSGLGASGEAVAIDEQTEEADGDDTADEATESASVS